MSDSLQVSATESVLQRVARQEPAAAADCLRAHGSLIWSMACRLFAVRADAEQAAEAAFIALFRAAPRYRPDLGSERLFVAALARRHLIDRLRRTGRRAAADVADPATATVGDDEASAALTVLEEAPAERRTAVTRAVLLGERVADTAAALQQPEGTVRGHLRDGLRAVHRALNAAEGAAATSPEDGTRSHLLNRLADAVSEPISDAERAEIEALLAEVPDVAPDAMERAAAAVELTVAHRESMPATLESRILDTWRREPGVTPPRGQPPGATLGTTGVAGRWLVAAGLVIALIGWWPTVTDWWHGAPPPAERLRALEARGTGVVSLPWSATGDPASSPSPGRVVWSTPRQEGYLVFEGLAPNAPDRRQYQLWIFDAGRGQYPVDGGVFDVPAGESTVVVPIDAKLPVRRPTRFAVTLEPPGGVVVSDRQRLVVTADVPAE